MLFPTLQFIGFFVVVLALNGFTWDRPTARKALLIAASYVFYAAWDIRFTLLMAFVSMTAWLGGLAVIRPRLCRGAKIVAITLMLGVLGVFKYYDFFMLNLTRLLEGTALARDLTG